VEAYWKVGMRDPKWDKLSGSFLDGYAQMLAGTPNTPPKQALAKPGKSEALEMAEMYFEIGFLAQASPLAGLSGDLGVSASGLSPDPLYKSPAP
jgi:hypothetical protein